jgi:hypothetical protein
MENALLADISANPANRAILSRWQRLKLPDEMRAPNGLTGLYQGTLTANPLVPQGDLFERKVASYRQRWPWLRPVRSSAKMARPEPAEEHKS